MLIAVGFIVSLGSCNDPEEPEIPNEEEVITTLSYTLTPDGGGTAVVMTFQDLDGDGGNAPTINGGELMANTTYSGSLELLNEIESPAEDITLEVDEEGEEHQFFFQSTVSGLTVSYDDSDANGDPIGIVTNLTTNNAGNGTLTITLRHEPNKGGDNVSSGDITNAGGETDIEVIFAIDVM